MAGEHGGQNDGYGNEGRPRVRRANTATPPPPPANRAARVVKPYNAWVSSLVQDQTTLMTENSQTTKFSTSYLNKTKIETDFITKSLILSGADIDWMPEILFDSINNVSEEPEAIDPINKKYTKSDTKIVYDNEADLEAYNINYELEFNSLYQNKVKNIYNSSSNPLKYDSSGNPIYVYSLNLNQTYGTISIRYNLSSPKKETSTIYYG